MIKPELERILDQVTTSQTRREMKFGFWGSKLPYCPVKDAVYQCQKSINALPEDSMDFKNDAKRLIGITLHELFQKNLGIQGKLYGHWTCDRCKELVAQWTTGPVEHCGRPCNYKEIRIKDEETEFSGMVDAIIISDSGVILVDFKTKDRTKLTKYRKEGIDPGDRSQLFAYKYMLTKPPYNFQFAGQAIVYIAREDPTKYVICEVENDDMSDLEFKRYVAQRQQSKEALKTGKISELKGFCTNIKDQPYCEYNSLCFGPARDANLNGEWEKSKFNE